GHLRLTTQLSFDTHFASHGGDLVGERPERIGHAVDGFGEGRHFTFCFENELLVQVPVGDRGHDLDDTAHLFGEVRRHEIHVVGQVLPSARHAFHIGLTAELSFRTHFFGHTGHFGGKGVELVHHGVDGTFHFKDLTAGIDRDLLRQVAFGHSGRDLCDVTHLV